MKLFGVRINNQDRTLFYNPYEHRYFIKDFKQKERIKYYDKEDFGLQDLTFPLFIDYYVQKRQGLLKPPVVGYLKITNRCNMQCSFCYAKANTKGDSVMDIDSIRFLKTILPRYSFRHCVISGGEPLLYFDLVKQIRNEFKHVSLFTNGSLINEDVAKWAIDTNSEFYTSLDYEIPGIEGHKSKDVRENLEKLINKYPELKERIIVTHCFAVPDLCKLSDLRKQCKNFEHDQPHVFNWLSTDKEPIDTLVLETEMDRIDSGEVNADASLFLRAKWFFDMAKASKFNCYGNCGPQIVVNFNNDVYLCQMPASCGEDYTKLCKVKDFTLEKYYESIHKLRLPEPCAADCFYKWYCGGICFANNKPESTYCGRNRILFPYYIYTLVNIKKIDPNEFLTYHVERDSSCQMSPEEYIVDRTL
jgi:MoaA/NifB/PqqE/SkfB family radical SAM enzyme